MSRHNAATSSSRAVTRSLSGHSGRPPAATSPPLASPMTFASFYTVSTTLPAQLHSRIVSTVHTTTSSAQLALSASATHSLHQLAQSAPSTQFAPSASLGTATLPEIVTLTHIPALTHHLSNKMGASSSCGSATRSFSFTFSSSSMAWMPLESKKAPLSPTTDLVSAAKPARNSDAPYGKHTRAQRQRPLEGQPRRRRQRQRQRQHRSACNTASSPSCARCDTATDAIHRQTRGDHWQPHHGTTLPSSEGSTLMTATSAQTMPTTGSESTGSEPLTTSAQMANTDVEPLTQHSSSPQLLANTNQPSKPLAMPALAFIHHGTPSCYPRVKHGPGGTHTITKPFRQTLAYGARVSLLAPHELKSYCSLRKSSSLVPLARIHNARSHGSSPTPLAQIPRRSLTELEPDAARSQSSTLMLLAS
ncbi:hypothetical protein BGW80DRAFT_1256417 [Lactifluus volemus]|nr:hypothetical protein BGW80DRAFT_1256417 [Lactifluus volemus]